MTLRTVHLYDELKDKFGGPYRLDIDTPGEAVRALSANFKDFMPTIRDGEWSLVMGEDIETGDSLDETMVGYSLGNSDLHIMPGVAGRKNSKGIIGLVLGVTLLAVGIGGAFLAADAAGAGLGAGFGAYAVGSAGFGITWAGIALMGASMLPQRDQLADDQRAESS